MNIQSKIQIIKNRAAISAKDMAILLGRQHLSVLRAIDAIPAECLRPQMFVIVGDEVFIFAEGVLMLNMSQRHLRMRRRIMMTLFIADDDHRDHYLKAFYAAMPPKKVVKLIARLNDFGLPNLAKWALKACLWCKGFKLLTEGNSQ